MTELLASAALALLPTLANAVLPSSSPPSQIPSPPTSTPTKSPAPPMSMEPPSSNTDRVALSSQTLPAAPPLLLGAHIPNSKSSVIQPFQHRWYYLTGTESKGVSTSITSFNIIKSLIKHFRDAELVSLEAIDFPSAPSYKIPVTVDLVWTPNDIKVEDSNVMETPGGTRVTCGGLQLLSSSALPCDLNYTNPILKCPIPYTNHPRLNAYFHQSPDALAEGVKASIKGTIFVRSNLRLSHPICAPP